MAHFLFRKMKKILNCLLNNLYFLRTLSFSLIILCILSEIYISCKLKAFKWNPETNIVPLLRIGLGLSLLVIAIYTYLAIHKIFEKSAKTCWWEPHVNGTSTELTWDDLYNLIAGTNSLDPLNVPIVIRWKWWLKTVPLQIAIYAAFTSLVLTIMDFIHNPRPRPFLLAGTSNWGNETFAEPFRIMMSNPTPIFVLIVGMATIFFTFRQIRAKVRADSRQAWIVKARQLIGEVVAEIDDHQAQLNRGNRKRAQEIWEKVNPKRLELELMLNPSEKDHRVLMYLIQIFSSWRTKPEDIQDADNLKKTISEYYKLLGRKDLWVGILGESERHQLVSYILRLSHVVLKREWERVKSIQ